MMPILVENQKPNYDPLLIELSDYIFDQPIESELAFSTAQFCLMDTLGCGILALNFPACSRLLGPWVEGQTTPQGARVPGTGYELDPIKAAFDIGTMVRWLDYNDTWLAQEWGHPSDNLGAILAVMDFMNRQKKADFTMSDLLEAMIRAHEIQGVLALENCFNGVGLDHVVLVKIASTAVVTKLLGGTKADVLKALSHAWLDGQSLRTYRHAPNTGSRKSWAAGDATSRAVRLAMLVLKGEEGYPSVLTVPRWGFQDVLFKGNPLKLAQPLGTYVMENILFKISYPAEFHGQTAVECALKLHDKFKKDLEHIEEVKITTQASGFKIINKTGPLHNPADRDHCLQYMVAVALLEGKLTAESYSDRTASNQKIDALRSKMTVEESDAYSKDYLDPNKRSIANKVDIKINGVWHSEEVHYPVGHKRRRVEGIPLLLEKFKHNLKSFYPEAKANALYDMCQSDSLMTMPVDSFMDLWVLE